MSHYCARHLDDILEVATVRPAVNQVEFHVGMGRAGANATDDRGYDATVGVHYQSFSPLCGPCGTEELVDGPLVSSIGRKYGRSGAQVSLRWLVQLGIPVIPKSHDLAHIRDNLDLFSWALSDDDMRQLTDARTPAVSGGGDGTSGDCAVP